MSKAILIGQLFKSVGAIEGKRKIQKLVHILQHFGVPFRFHFGAVHYGPYCSELDAQLRVFERENLICEEITPAGKYYCYQYKAQPALDQMLANLSSLAELPQQELARELNAKSSQELEAISTIYFLDGRGKRGSELEETFCMLKPQFASAFEERLVTARDLETRYGMGRGEAKN